jgi:hypothetical protein
MASTFAWLDHSEEQRRRVLDVIDLFKEQGTVDELGLGTIRDAVADILFPGTSNLMTKAAYFFFVPWIYLRLEYQKTPTSEIAAKARREELRLIERLLESGETDGVIGRRARGSLRRLPSNVYWAGMRVLGICQLDSSQDSYHRSLDRFYERRRIAQKTDDGERVGNQRDNWHPRLPAPPDDWPTRTSLQLTKEQAEFLRDQIVMAGRESLYALLAQAPDAPTDVAFPWAHPSQSSFSEKIQWQLDHARNISEVMYGAALLYNLILAELTQKKELVDDYRARLLEWSEMLAARGAALNDWDRLDAWRCVESQGSRIPRPTRDFVDRWCELAIGGKSGSLADSPQARSLVSQRERRLKGPLARVENRRARERWQGASSSRRLQYRWTNAAVILNDIVTALQGRPDA